MGKSAAVFEPFVRNGFPLGFTCSKAFNRTRVFGFFQKIKIGLFMAFLAFFWPFLSSLQDSLRFRCSEIEFLRASDARRLYLGACFGIFHKFVFSQKRQGVKGGGEVGQIIISKRFFRLGVA